MNTRIVKSLLVILLLFTLNTNAETQNNKPVKLVLQLTVDQLRGDIINKFDNRLTDDGFKYLLKNGVNFTKANYIHAITKTAPGHATLATGSIPAIHGIVNNDWYDIKNEREKYSCEDKSYKIFGEENEDHLGRSPANLEASTTADEIYLSTNGKPKIFGVSVKDRGAIFLGGFSGKAFWYSSNTGGFTSSTYYYDSLPDWADEWNKKDIADEYYRKGWDLLREWKSYNYTDEKYNNYEKTRDGLGNTFPHSFENISKEKFLSYIAYTPFGDRLTYDFVKELVNQEGIGEDDIVDYLSVSFSCTDYIGHLFGPNSLEYEDQILNLDKVLSELFHFIDQKVGLNNTLIVLSADHGVCESPDYLEANNISTGVLSVDNLVEKVNEFGKDSLNLNFNLVKEEIPPYIYLDVRKLRNTGYSLTDVENMLKDLLTGETGVYKVYTSDELEKNHLPQNIIDRKVKNAYYKGRSGHIYIVNEPNWYMAGNAENRGNAATHGSPWYYDTFVPLLFKVPGVIPAEVSVQTGPQDISSTICDYLKIKAPGGAVGKSLLQYMEFKKNNIK